MINKIKNIITVQHPESIHHTNGMIGSWTDWELTDKGKQQAKSIALKLKMELGDQKYVLYSSPLMRTKQTAAFLSQSLRTDILFSDSLKERSLGKAIGKSVKWLQENLESVEQTVDDRCFSDAESRRDVWERLLPFYQVIMDHEEPNIMLVSHGDTLSIFNIMWLGLGPEVLNRINLSGLSGGVSFLYQTDKGKRVIKRLSDTSYMGL